jgi:hypothetical protein
VLTAPATASISQPAGLEIYSLTLFIYAPILYNKHMIRIIFKIDKDQDAKNWNRVMAIKELPYGVSRKNESVDNKMIKDFSADELAELEKIKQQLEDYFTKDGQEIFKIIEQITGQPIYANEFYASFTTAGFRPYDLNSNWFMVPVTDNFYRQTTSICHELLHLQIGHYYKEYCLNNGISEKQFSELNEILTFLINDGLFQRFNLLPDEGYPKHKESRMQLETMWREERSFKNLITVAITMV